jgi:hypothetical protein
MRVAYVTALDCGAGHAVRGRALVAAGAGAGIEVSAYGPGLDPMDQVGTPDLLLGDLDWRSLRELRSSFGCPAWLLVRWMGPGHLDGCGWERRISIEPAADAMPGITHRIPPIVGPDRWRPADGSEVRAGYNAWWESVWYGWHDRVRWTTEGSPERQARIDAGPVQMVRNGADLLMEMIR